MTALISTIKGSPGGCCWNLVRASVLGIDPPAGDPTPPIPSNLFYATVPNSTTIAINGAPFTFAVDGPTVAASLQAVYIGGAFGFAFISDISFWILADTAPLDWTADGNPIIFNDGGAATETCYETATFQLNFGEPTVDWRWRYVQTTAFYAELNTAGMPYSDPAFPTYLDTFIPQVFGAAATYQMFVTTTTVFIKIYDTYNAPTQVTSEKESDNTQQGDAINIASCTPIVPNPLPLIFSFTNIANTPVVDPSSVADWNAALFPTIPFDSVNVNGNDVELYGYDGTGLSGYAFNTFTDLLAVNDSGGIITTLGDSFFGGSGCITIIMDALLDTNEYFAESCADLISVSINSCTTIGEFAFANCQQLTTMSGPSVTTILLYAFNDCFTLTDISFPLATSIGEFGFADCLLTGAFDLASLTTIGDYTFSACGFTDVTLSALTTAGVSSFSDCPNLINITLAALTSCGGSFVRNSFLLESINVPLCEDFGGTTGNDLIFEFITGQAITCTVPVSRQTCDGGNPDGDLLDLIANNPSSTIVYV